MKTSNIISFVIHVNRFYSILIKFGFPFHFVIVQLYMLYLLTGLMAFWLSKKLDLSLYVKIS